MRPWITPRRVLATVAASLMLAGAAISTAGPAAAAGESFDGVSPSSIEAAAPAQSFDFTLTLAVNNTWRGDPTQGGYYLMLPGFDLTGLTCSDVTFTPALDADAATGLAGFCDKFEAGKSALHFIGPYIDGEATRQYTVTVNTVVPPQSDGCYRVGLGNWDASEYLGGQNLVVGAGCPNSGGSAPEPRRITLRIDSNGVGSCDVKEVSGVEGLWTTMPAGPGASCTDPTDTRYWLGKYNTSPDGSGTMVYPGGNIYLSGDNTLYALWSKPYTVASPVQNVKAVPTRNQVTVTWEAPASDGNSEIRAYLVIAKPSYQLCITRTSGPAADANPFICVFDKPKAGQVNTYEVQALNARGWNTVTASTPVASWDFAMTDVNRSKKFFGLRQQIDMSGTSAGLPSGTPIVAQWQYVNGANATPNADKWQTMEWTMAGGKGNFSADKMLPLRDTKTAVAVRFLVKDPVTGVYDATHSVNRVAR